ncbi:MAG: DUF2442 domain-containing protein [Chloroflexota bacterium]|nr:DUF2442 domain-containing protein [Chloroflexota bacterium]
MLPTYITELHADRNDAVSLQFYGDALCIATKDGREIKVPIDWFTFLDRATTEQRSNFQLYGHSIYWPDLEDGIDMDVILLGRAGT